MMPEQRQLTEELRDAIRGATATHDRSQMEYEKLRILVHDMREQMNIMHPALERLLFAFDGEDMTELGIKAKIITLWAERKDFRDKVERRINQLVTAIAALSVKVIYDWFQQHPK